MNHLNKFDTMKSECQERSRAEGDQIAAVHSAGKTFSIRCDSIYRTCQKDDQENSLHVPRGQTVNFAYMLINKTILVRLTLPFVSPLFQNEEIHLELEETRQQLLAAQEKLDASEATEQRVEALETEVQALRSKNNTLCAEMVIFALYPVPFMQLSRGCAARFFSRLCSCRLQSSRGR